MKKNLLEAIVFIALSVTIACQHGRRVDDGAAQGSPADSCSASFQDFLNYFKDTKYVYACRGTKLFREGYVLNFYQSDTLKTHYGKFLPPHDDCPCYDSLQIYHMPQVRIKAPNYICLSFLRVCDPEDYTRSFIEFILATYSHQGRMLDDEVIAVADDSTYWAAIESSSSPIHLTLLKEVYKRPQGGFYGNTTCKVSKEEISINEEGQIRHDILRQWNDSCCVEEDTIFIKTPLAEI